MTTIDDVGFSDSVGYDLDAPDVEAHVMVEVPIYGIPERMPTTSSVRVLVGGVDYGPVDATDDGESVLAVLFDQGAFRLDGWRIVAVKPIEFQPIRERQ